MFRDKFSEVRAPRYCIGAKGKVKVVRGQHRESCDNLTRSNGRGTTVADGVFRGEDERVVFSIK